MNITNRQPLGLKVAPPTPKEMGMSRATYKERVKHEDCCVCGACGPSDFHHPISRRYSGKKRDDYFGIPLCKRCHQVGPLAIHNGQESWEERNGLDYEFIPKVWAAVGVKYEDDCLAVWF